MVCSLKSFEGGRREVFRECWYYHDFINYAYWKKEFDHDVGWPTELLTFYADNTALKVFSTYNKQKVSGIVKIVPLLTYHKHVTHTDMSKVSLVVRNVYEVFSLWESCSLVPRHSCSMVVGKRSDWVNSLYISWKCIQFCSIITAILF